MAKEQVLGGRDSLVLMEAKPAQGGPYLVGSAGTQHEVVQLQQHAAHTWQLWSIEHMAIGAGGLDNDQRGVNLVHQVAQRLSRHLHWSAPNTAPCDGGRENVSIPLKRHPLGTRAHGAHL